MIERYKQQFIFTQDYKVEQQTYGPVGDFPTGTQTTIFKKGDIVEGTYALQGCHGAGCTPVEIVEINVNWQKWPVEKSILIPQGEPGERLAGLADLTECYGTDCIQSAPTTVSGNEQHGQNVLPVVLAVLLCFAVFSVIRKFKKK